MVKMKAHQLHFLHRLPPTDLEHLVSFSGFSRESQTTHGESDLGLVTGGAVVWMEGEGVSMRAPGLMSQIPTNSEA